MSRYLNGRSVVIYYHYYYYYYYCYYYHDDDYDESYTQPYFVKRVCCCGLMTREEKVSGLLSGICTANCTVITAWHGMLLTSGTEGKHLVVWLPTSPRWVEEKPARRDVIWNWEGGFKSRTTLCDWFPAAEGHRGTHTSPSEGPSIPGWSSSFKGLEFDWRTQNDF